MGQVELEKQTVLLKLLKKTERNWRNHCDYIHYTPLQPLPAQVSIESAVERIRDTDVLIINEIAMLSQKLFDHLVSVFASVRGKTQF